MSIDHQPRRIGEVLRELDLCVEGEVVLRYTAPVWVTVDLSAGRVSRVEVGDTEVELERDQEGRAVVVAASDGAGARESEVAAGIAEGSMWPAWRWAR